MKNHVLMALVYTMFLGMLTLGLCALSKGDLHNLGEKIDHASMALGGSKHKNVLSH